MDSHTARIALVSRCPELSDGAKVTMVELLFHVGNGKIPSLSELKRLRNVSRSTVQLHFQELVEAGVVKRIIGEKNKVFCRIQDKRLLRLNGLTTMNEVGEWMHNQEAAEANNPKVIRSLLTDPADWQPVDAWNYFKTLGKRKNKKLGCKKMTSEQYPKIRKMIRDYGGPNLKLMMDHFVLNFRRMGVAYTIVDLYERREGLLK